MSHCPEPWKAVEREDGAYEIDHDADGGVTGCDKLNKEDAERIVACVNACRGIPNEMLHKFSDEDGSGIRFCAEYLRQHGHFAS